MTYLVQNPATGDIEYVQSLDGYDGWTTLGEGEFTRPIAGAEWNGTRWLHPIPMLKLRKWNEIRDWRDVLKAGGCDTPHGRVDTDPESMEQIMLHAAIARATPLTFSISWTMEDDSPVVLDAIKMQDVLMAVGARHRDLHATARALKNQIMGPTATRASIGAIEWPPEDLIA